MANAACKGSTPLFFAERGDVIAVREARRVCDGCAVWAACLDYAVTDTAPRHGVLAGLTPDERFQLRRSMPATVRTSGQLPAPPPPGGFPHLRSSAIALAWTRGQLLQARAADEPR